ncbi:MAG: energy-coupling factor transporter transmembrane protein EcfT [Ruminococcaceae bacterium]|nr:energy-coupling factor transporter transmembrane protein EcfT [Oscillospiraceae bacterium]
MIGFNSYHPFVNLLYFVFVIGFSMFFMNPVCLGISFFCSFVCSVLFGGKKAIRTNLLYMLPMMIFMSVTNPLFNHNGATIIRYLPSGNPLTVESILYGFFASLMIISVISWFSFYNKVMTSDKFIYLFGKVIPSLALIISMTLRFVPRFLAQMRSVSNARRCIGRDLSKGKLTKRIRNGLDIISVMVTWSLENAVDTSDSMRSRGYGLEGRSSFSIFRFDKRDAAALAYIALFGVFTLVCGISGGMDFRFFPTFRMSPPSFLGISGYISYFLLCICPVIIEIWEVRRWNASRSKI